MIRKTNETETPEGDLVFEKDGVTWVIPAEVAPNYDLIQIEDGKPVENAFIEKQLRLLTEPLYASWQGPGEGRQFKVYANVGLFYASKKAGLCPDVMLSLDVDSNVDLSLKENRSYFLWVIGKVPEVVIEIVSDRRGGEASTKMREYARIKIPNYVIFDPQEYLNEGVLRAFCLVNGIYQPTEAGWFPEATLGLTLWKGFHEGYEETWLCWCDCDGRVIPTGRERAEQERQRAELLAAKLRELGIDPGV